MLKFLKWTGILVAPLVIAALVIYQFFPGVMLSGMQYAAASGSGLTARTIEVDGYTAHYYEGGPSDGPTLVLLHGLGDDKNSFVTSVGELTETHRVILPDLQAHGENAQIEGRDYSIRGQVEFVHALLTELGVSDVTIGGNSMGGHTAAAYAYHHQDQVDGLIVLNGTGMQLDEDSVYLYYPDVVDEQFINDMFARVFVNPPSIPAPILGHMIDDLNPKVPFFNALIAEVENGEDFRLDEMMQDVAVPALVLWGEADPVVPVPYAEGYHAALQNSELRFINAGHSPQFEVPDVVQAEILDFLH